MTAVRVDAGAVVFDMDGVLFEGSNFWLDLHRAYGTETEAVELAGQFLRSQYARLARVTAQQLWRGRSAAPYLELVRQRHYQPRAVELVARLRAAGVVTLLVSSGPDLLADRARRELGLDAAVANGLGIEEGRLSGELRLRVDDTSKGEVALELLAAHRVPPDRAVSVGDTLSDVPVALAVRAGIAYGSESPELLAASRYALPHGELLRVADIVVAELALEGLPPDHIEGFPRGAT